MRKGGESVETTKSLECKFVRISISKGEKNKGEEGQFDVSVYS